MSHPDSTDLLFSLQRYEERRGEVRLHMSHFFLRYLNDIYQAFEGDLAMAIVLGEISHHNTARVFSPEKATNPTLRSLQDAPSFWTVMDGCNAYSMSCATGIPRETVRRKIAELKRRGWIEEVPKQGLRITQACGDHFGADYSLRFLNRLLRASRHIEALLAENSEQSTEMSQPLAASATPLPRVRKPSSKPRPQANPTKKNKA